MLQLLLLHDERLGALEKGRSGDAPTPSSALRRAKRSTKRVQSQQPPATNLLADWFRVVLPRSKGPESCPRHGSGTLLWLEADADPCHARCGPTSSTDSAT